MKQAQKRKSNCEEENLQLLGAIEKYNSYVMDHLKGIEDFDVWYEENFKMDFPKCWYTLVRNSKL